MIEWKEYSGISYADIGYTDSSIRKSPLGFDWRVMVSRACLRKGKSQTLEKAKTDCARAALDAMQEDIERRKVILERAEQEALK